MKEQVAQMVAENSKGNAAGFLGREASRQRATGRRSSLNAGRNSQKMMPTKRTAARRSSMQGYPAPKTFRGKGYDKSEISN
jgi:hypothetical protein